jgi:hypothetical protein
MMDFMSLLQPSEDDRKRALTQGLLSAGLGILANNRGRNAGPAIGAGGLLGMQGYQQSLGQSRQDAMQRMQFGMMAQKMQEEQKRKQGIEAMLNPQAITPEQAGSMPGGPTNENAEMIGRPTQTDIGGMPLDQARMLYSIGGEGALSKALAEYAKPTEFQRETRGLPTEDARFALGKKLGINPEFIQADTGGALTFMTRDPRNNNMTTVGSMPKTAAPGAVPFNAQGMTPDQFRAFQLQQAERSASRNTNITNVNAKSDNAYFTKRREAQAQQFQDLEKSAESADRQIQTLDRFIRANQSGTAGGAQPLISGVQNFLSTFGYEPKSLTNVRVMEQAVGDILQNKMSELGARGLTDKDMQILREALPRVDTDRVSREQVAGIIRKSAQSTIDSYRASRAEEARIYPEFTQNTPAPLWLRKYEGPQQAQPTAGTFERLPDPSMYRGRRMKGDDGTIYRSDGSGWVRE